MRADCGLDPCQPCVERRPVSRAKAVPGELLGTLVAGDVRVNQALNETESSVSVWSASRSARFALVRSADAFASDTDDSVLHFAAAYPE